MAKSLASRSIIFQLLMAMGSIAILALFSMMMSVAVTLNTQSDAEAINVAGSMRMQAYRMALMLAQADSVPEEALLQRVQEEREVFREKLYNSSIAKLAAEHRDEPLNAAYQQIVEHFETQGGALFTPADLKQPGQAVDFDIHQFRANFLVEVDAFVADIDKLVLAFQQNTEDKIELLGFSEGLSIFLTVMAMLFAVMKADQNLLTPLKDLMCAANMAGQGDFSYRTRYQEPNELGLLCNTFNSMAESLARHYRRLEDMVNQKTAQLQLSNRTLNFLYRSAKRLSDTPYDEDMLRELARDLEDITKAKRVYMRFVNLEGQEPYTEGSGLEGEKGDGDKQKPSFTLIATVPDRVLAERVVTDEFNLPIAEHGQSFGELCIDMGGRSVLESWQVQLFKATADNIAAAYALQSREAQHHRVILLEERSVIARELHDSLAQSLSYMKMQVTRLSKLIERESPKELVMSNVTDIQQGLNAAYKHLRELLNTFRLKLDAPTLYQALESATREFGEDGGHNIELHYQLGHCPLTPNEDIHVLHIMREAISNAVKHSKAEKIVVVSQRELDGSVVFSVLDDGVGIADMPGKTHHYGLSTMQERAAVLNGQVKFGRRENGGTEVSLRFIPAYLKSAS